MRKLEKLEWISKIEYIKKIGFDLTPTVCLDITT